jgi:quercetin dioxygenase-like cupin family protein
MLSLTFSTLQAQDAVKAAPKQCKVEFENQQVRVLRWNVGPHQKTAMHEHPAMVSVALTAGHTRFTSADGKTTDVTSKPGQVTWSAATKHSSESLGSAVSELIQVELKGGAAHAPAAGGAKADPAKVDSKHYKVEFENQSVRVLRISYGPGEKSVMHSHPDSVAIYLTDGMTRMTTPDGKSQDLPSKAGGTSWTPAGSHLPQNISNKPFELVLVELKK